jgi:hypothetical protein
MWVHHRRSGTLARLTMVARTEMSVNPATTFLKCHSVGKGVVFSMKIVTNKRHVCERTDAIEGGTVGASPPKLNTGALGDGCPNGNAYCIT